MVYYYWPIINFNYKTRDFIFYFTIISYKSVNLLKVFFFYRLEIKQILLIDISNNKKDKSSKTNLVYGKKSWY